MKPKFSSFSKTVIVLCALLASASLASAQSQVASRIHEAVDDTRLVTLQGSTHVMARPEFDRGVVADSMPLNRIWLMLQRSPDQETNLHNLLDAQQDKTSVNYHKWLTPEQFGLRFGPSDSDVQTVVSWLQSKGFTVNGVSHGRTIIEFSGNAGLIRTAFHTEIHNYEVHGEHHIANSTNPQIPAALAPVVKGIASLHNFFSKPELVRVLQPISVRYEKGKPLGHVTFSAGNNAIGPLDFAKIYNVPSSASGAGETIAIVGRSSINISDVENFQSVLGVTANAPNIVFNGPDPGDLGGGEEIEALLDNEWANAVSQGASIDFVVSESTETDDGVTLSAQYIVDNNLADVMTESFGECEAADQNTTAAIQSIPEQAAAQGISYFASTGDAGAEDCDDPDSEAVAQYAIGVDVPASTPFVTAVGGTQFNEHGDDNAYWSTSSSVVGTTGESALKYIPEDVWNESCEASQSGCSSPNIASAGGGVSTLFSKPAWQAGVTGIPADGARDLPDVSLNASAAHDPYLVCADGGCVPDSSGEISILGVGGTSASTPSFAGIMSLVDHARGARQGLATYVLYKLAATETFSSCNASSTTVTIGSTCIFNDVTVGNNAVPGESAYGTSAAKYQAGVGFDEASGLGSVNVGNLISDWGNATFLASTTTLSLTSPTFVHGTSVTANGTVTSGGSNTPTGDIAFLAAGTTLPGVGDITLAAGTGNTVSYSAPIADLPGGSYSVTARYAGDTQFAASTSNAVPVVVTPEPSSVTLAAFLVDFANGTYEPVTAPVPAGSTIYVRATVTGTSGEGWPTGFVKLVDSAHAADSGTLHLNSSGYAEIQTTGFSTGAHNYVASYLGDPSFDPSTSAAVAFQIVAGAFTLGLSPNSATIANAGGTTSTTITVTDTNQFAGDVTLSCSVTRSSGSASNPTCSFSKSTLVLSEAATSASATLTVTASSSSHLLMPLHFPGNRQLLAIGTVALGLSMISMLFWFAAPARRRLSTVLALIIFGSIVGMAACGGGGSSNSGGGGSGGSSSAFTVAVTAASGGTSQTSNFTVTVQ